MKNHLKLLLIPLAAIISACATNERIMMDKTVPSAICEVGDTLEIALEENPTTGYVWRITDDGSPVLKLENQSYQARAASGNIAGAGGTIIYIFKAVNPGETKVKLVCARPWENNKPINKAVFTVTAK